MPEETPAPGGGPGERQPGAPEDETVICRYEGRDYHLNDRICDGRRQQWQCNTTGWFRTGAVCTPRREP